MFSSIRDIQEKDGKKRFIDDVLNEMNISVKKFKEDDDQNQTLEYFTSEQNNCNLIKENLRNSNNFINFSLLKNELEKLVVINDKLGSVKENVDLNEDDCMITGETKKCKSNNRHSLPKGLPLQILKFVENTKKSETTFPLFPSEKINQFNLKKHVNCFKNNYKPFEYFHSEISKLPKVKYPFVNCKVFASTLFDNGPVLWKTAEVKEIVNIDDLKFRIYFDSYRNSAIKRWTLKELACFEMPKRYLPIGTRVIGLSDENKTRWEAGVIAEIESTNEKRVLIFFDSGLANYCYKHEIRQIMNQNTNVWEDVKSKDMQDFLKTYMSKQPYRQLVSLDEGHSISLNWNNKWFKTIVDKVDKSMVKLYFENGLYEWVYRGSTRLKPLYDAIVKEDEKEKSIDIDEKKRLKKCDDKSAKKETITCLQQNSTVKEFVEPTCIIYTQDQFGNTEIPLNPLEEKNVYGKRINEENKLSKQILREYYPHLYCNENCVMSFELNLFNVNTERKLMLPLYYGWSRQVVKLQPLIDRNNVKQFTNIVYFAPCGKLFATMDDIDEYLLKTKSKLTIDCFAINLSVNVSKIFLSKGIKLDDISNGLEKVPISLANIYNENMPSYMRYRTRRNPKRGVRINDDPGFLVCCDCKDGCRNKEKCACWQLTYETQTKKRPKLGYTHKRLCETITTGIYECNENCSCKTECNNRVVQNNVDYRIQLFKTSKRGWGVRAMEDIPKGAFICHYVGRMLTDKVADKSGKEQGHGDEFFCDLDYIEQAEELKEGYEENAYQLSDDVNNIDGRISNKDVVTEKNKNFKLRHYFGADGPIVMDAKEEGNIGKYFNHSCNPNMIVQNVFVDTHDPRYPWISFFTSRTIEAGEELTWDYGYKVDSIPDRVLDCLCGEKCCRGRLL